MKKTKINIGIVGLGRIGKMHVRNICQTLPLFNLKTIVDPALDIDFTRNLEGVIISDNIENKNNDTAGVHIDMNVGGIINKDKNASATIWIQIIK